MIVRIYNKSYNLTNFAEIHKGGSEFIERASKMIDATPLFESYHVNSEAILSSISHLEYNEPFYTFKRDGFYMTTKQRVNAYIRDNTILINKYQYMYDLFFWILCIMYYTFHLYFQFFSSTFVICTLGPIQGLLRPLLAGYGHNYMHNGSSKSIIFYVTGMSLNDWKWEHTHLHHVYTNTFLDVDWNAINITLKKLPTYLRLPLMYIKLNLNIIITFLSDPLKNWTDLIGRIILIIEMYTFYFNPLLIATSMSISIIWFLWIDFSNHYLSDTPYMTTTNMDWGEAQFITSKDFWIVDYGFIDSILGIGLGFQRAHHLFPKMSHGTYFLINPIILQVAKEFKIKNISTPHLFMNAGPILRMLHSYVRTYLHLYYNINVTQIN